MIVFNNHEYCWGGWPVLPTNSLGLTNKQYCTITLHIACTFWHYTAACTILILYHSTPKRTQAVGSVTNWLWRGQEYYSATMVIINLILICIFYVVLIHVYDLLLISIFVLDIKTLWNKNSKWNDEVLNQWFNSRPPSPIYRALTINPLENSGIMAWDSLHHDTTTIFAKYQTWWLPGRTC